MEKNKVYCSGFILILILTILKMFISSIVIFALVAIVPALLVFAAMMTLKYGFNIKKLESKTTFDIFLISFNWTFAVVLALVILVISAGYAL